MTSNRAAFDEVRLLAYNSIADTYLPVASADGVGPFAHAIRILHIINSTNGIMMISTNGVTDMMPILAGTGVIYDFTSDQDQNERFRLQANSQIYVRYITEPTDMGGPTFWVGAVYGIGE